MYCKRCGRYNVGNVEKCKYCGSTELKSTEGSVVSNYGNSKETVGVLLGIFLGFLGFAIGLAIYEGSDRETFLTGWAKATVCMSCVAVLIVIIAVLLPMCIG